MPTVTSSTQANGTTLLTYAVTIPSGTKALVILSNSQSSLNATFNGSGVTHLESGFGKSFGDVWADIWVLANPPVGTYNVVLDAFPNTGIIYSVAHTVIGVDATNLLDTSKNTNPGSGGSGDTDTTLTTNVDNSIIFSACVQYSSTTANPAMAVKYGATSSYDVNPFNNYKFGSSYQSTTTSGSQNIGWDNVTGRPGGADHCTLVTVSLRALSATISVGGFILSMLRRRSR